MPCMTAFGLFTYALIPMFFPQNAYLGLVIGTIIFSISAGLSEVLLSPVIAAIPSDNPQKDMSFLHSLYAFGVFTVVVISTLFLRFFGSENWMYLTAKTYAPAVTRRKDIGQTKFDQCLSCGAFSSRCSHWSRHISLQSIK